MSKLIQTPPDGFTPEEVMILECMSELTIDSIYSKLPTNRMKAILALHFELGYNQETVARIFGVSQGLIAQEISRIRQILEGKDGRDHRGYQIRQPRVQPEDLIHLLINADKLIF